MKKNEKNSYFVHTIVMTALLTALAVVINMFKIDIPIAGAPVMRISFSGPFVRLSSILFGPIYGGISGGLLDILSYLVKPTGGYIFPMLLTAILNSVMVALLWSNIKNYSIKFVKNSYIVLFSIVGLIGTINFIAKTFMPQSFLGTFVNSIGKKAPYAAEGFIIAAIIGFVLLFVIYIMGKKDPNLFETYLKMIISIGIPSLIVTTINTYILRLFMPLLADKIFMIVLIPRLLDDILMMPVQAYIIIVLMKVYQRVNKKVII